MNTNKTQSLKSLDGIRICVISTVPFFIETQLLDQIKYLLSCGAKVSVVSSPAAESSAIKKLPLVTYHEILMSRGVDPLRDIYSLILLTWYLLRNTQDIIHSTTPKAGFLAAVAAKITGVRIRLHTFTGQAWVGLKGVKKCVAKLSDKTIGFLNTHCFADSPSQCRFLIDQKIVYSGHISVLGSGSLAGVSLSRFDPDRFSEDAKNALKNSLGIPLEAKILLFVGRINEDKGIRELLQAFGMIELGVCGEVHLLMVGPLDHGSGVGKGISEQTLKMIPRVHWVGFSEAPEQYMAISDFLCLPSYREGFGTVVIEAGAMGLPAVGTKIYGLSDAVEDGVTGCLVHAKQVVELAIVINELLSDNERLKLLGLAARKRAIEHFDSALINRTLVNKYQAFLREYQVTEKCCDTEH